MFLSIKLDKKKFPPNSVIRLSPVFSQRSDVTYVSPIWFWSSFFFFYCCTLDFAERLEPYWHIFRPRGEEGAIEKPRRNYEMYVEILFLLQSQTNASPPRLTSKMSVWRLTAEWRLCARGGLMKSKCRLCACVCVRGQQKVWGLQVSL